MRLSREKINHLSKIILKEFEKNDDIDFKKEPNEVRLQIVKIFSDELKVDDVIDDEVRKTLNSYSKKLPEGTSEWDVMYNKLYEESLKKKRGF